MSECAACGGEGVVWAFEDRWSPVSGHYTRDWQTYCPECNGRGEVAGEECDAADLGVLLESRPEGA
jgi:DnaJ-class molecular chaperone